MTLVELWRCAAGGVLPCWEVSGSAQPAAPFPAHPHFPSSSAHLLFLWKSCLSQLMELIRSQHPTGFSLECATSLCVIFRQNTLLPPASHWASPPTLRLLQITMIGTLPSNVRNFDAFSFITLRLQPFVQWTLVVKDWYSSALHLSSWLLTVLTLALYLVVNDRTKLLRHNMKVYTLKLLQNLWQMRSFET